MKNYSNFINGFISNYEIKDGEILIYTPLTKKNEPIRKALTKENINKYEGRLENQYKLIIANQDEIIKYNNKKYNLLILLFTIIGAVAVGMLFILFGTTLLTRIFFGSYLASIFAGISIKEKIAKNFKQELKQYIRYMENRESIEELAHNDDNVLAYLNTDTLSKIEDNEKLKQLGTIDSAYNIDLMDKISLKELKKLLLRYQISESLEEEQNFKLPKENTIFKTRKLTKTKENLSKEDK